MIQQIVGVTRTQEMQSGSNDTWVIGFIRSVKAHMARIVCIENVGETAINSYYS